MTRRIVTKSDVHALINAGQPSLPLLDMDGGVQVKAAPPPDNYAARLLKLIPAEVVTVFVTLDGVIRSAGNQVAPNAYWGIFALLVIGTYFYILRTTRMSTLQGRRGQALLSALSFMVWVFAIGGPFTFSHAGWYKPVYGAIILPLYTFAVPIFFGTSSEAT